MPKKVERNRKQKETIDKLLEDLVYVQLVADVSWNLESGDPRSCNSLSDEDSDAWPGDVGKLGNPGNVRGWKIGGKSSEDAVARLHFGFAVLKHRNCKAALS
jgi:hypothetical protein